MIRAVLFDGDGVTLNSPRPFSHIYAEQRGINPEDFIPFFQGEFSDAMIGKADLKELIVKYHDLWQWDKDPQELLDWWFISDSQIDTAVLAFIKEQRQNGLPVFLATNQEAYRTHYFRNVLFKDVFDDIFASSDIGHLKKEPAYWESVLDKLAVNIPSIKPEQIVYFDDSQDGINTAGSLGIDAYLYTGLPRVRQIFSENK